MIRQPHWPLYRPAWLVAAFIAACIVPATPAVADLDTHPNLFTHQPTPVTGQFGWDEFSAAAGFGGPHAPDVVSSGTGSSTLAATGVPQPMDGPPFGLVTSTQNLYTGGTIGHWDIELADLSTAEANTTVVLQVAALGAIVPDSLALDGAAPTSFVDRGVASGVTHDIDVAQAQSDTNYYWAEWQVPAASAYTLEFSGAHTHLSLTGATVDYFNTAELLDAVEAGTIPEPSAVALAGIGIGALLFAASRRRRRSLDASDA